MGWPATRGAEIGGKNGAKGVSGRPAGTGGGGSQLPGFVLQALQAWAQGQTTGTPSKGNGKGKGKARPADGPGTSTGHGIRAQRKEWTCAFCLTSNFMARGACRFCSCPRAAELEPNAAKQTANAGNTRGIDASRPGPAPPGTKPCKVEKEAGADGPAAVGTQAGTHAKVPTEKHEFNEKEAEALKAAATLLSAAGLMPKRALHRVPGCAPAPPARPKAPVGLRLDRARGITEKLAKQVTECHRVCHQAGEALIQITKKWEDAQAATAALEAEVLATTTAEGKKRKERPGRENKRDSSSQMKLAAVRAAMEAEGADPLDMLKAVQAALTATADEEDSEGDSESDADAAASMSAQSGDEGGAEPEFESAGEGWLRRDGKGRSRSAGAERQRSADPLRRNRDRSPRLGRPARGGKAADSAAAAAVASADSDEV